MSDRQIDGDDEVLYHVVVNHEDQYSVWLADQPAPAGWTVVGLAQSKQRCLDHIERVWTDLRPRSLRQKMGEE